MITWLCFPKSDKPPKIIENVVKEFRKVSNEIDSPTHNLKSNEVLETKQR